MYSKVVVRDQGATSDTGTLALPIGRGGNSKDSSTVSQLKVTPLLDPLGSKRKKKQPWGHSPKLQQ